MTWFSLTFLLFLTPWLWDGAAHFVRKCWRLVSGSGRSGARPVPGTAATVADGCLPAERPVPDFWKAA